jgi:hypothetical protein
MSGTQIGLPHANRKRLIALVHMLLKFAPSKARACVKARTPIPCPCSGAEMKIVKMRIRATNSAVTCTSLLFVRAAAGSTGCNSLLAHLRKRLRAGQFYFRLQVLQRHQDI